jgi:signal transduction histidine kinase
VTKLSREQWPAAIVRPGLEAVLALGASASFFALTAVVIIAADDRHASVFLFAALCAAAILAVGNVWGSAFSLPVSLAAFVAFDWFYVPPTHPAGLPDAPNALQLGLFLVVAVLIGQVASRAQRRASGSEEVRDALAAEQSALRRVATLVARGVPPDQLFAAVAKEIRGVMGLEIASITRYEEDDRATVVAMSGAGSRLTASSFAVDGDSILARIAKTRCPARVDDYEEISGPFGERARRQGARSGVGAPIIVEDRLWGAALAFSTRAFALPADMEDRIAKFTELIAIAIANAESRTELTASRARIVAAADESRRRLERDLHDGIQQRLVSLTLELRNAAASADERGMLQAQLARIGEGLGDALDELREISRGIHPAILSRGGLEHALKAVARRSAVPVELDLSLDGQLPEQVEVAAYYVASEALANAAKHARAASVRMRAAPLNGALQLSISDDGVGGADPRQGSGLIGLKDRVSALGGTVSVTSSAGEGTSVAVMIPVD